VKPTYHGPLITVPSPGRQSGASRSKVVKRAGTATQSSSKTKRVGNRKAARSGDSTPWPPVLSQDYAHLSLRDLLRQRLAQFVLDTNKTWAQQLIEAWIGEALGGNFRALQEIVERIDGDSTSASATPASALDEHTARKILESLCDPNDDLPSD